MDTSASVDPLIMRPDDAGAGGKEFAFADTERTVLFMELLGSEPYSIILAPHRDRVSTRGTGTLQKKDYQVFLIPGLSRVAFVNNARGEGTYILSSDGDQRQLIDGLLPIDKPRLVAAGAILVEWNKDTAIWQANVRELLASWPKVAKPSGGSVEGSRERFESLTSIAERLAGGAMSRAKFYEIVKETLFAIVEENSAMQEYIYPKGGINRKGSPPRVVSPSPLLKELEARLEARFAERKETPPVEAGWKTKRTLAEEIKSTSGSRFDASVIFHEIEECAPRLIAEKSEGETVGTKVMVAKTGHAREHLSPELCKKIFQVLVPKFKELELSLKDASLLHELVARYKALRPEETVEYFRTRIFAFAG
ncbi:MAG: hypothetical protein AAB425_00665, partial [Bdellovibrionota bacterium]